MQLWLWTMWNQSWLVGVGGCQKYSLCLVLVDGFVDYVNTAVAVKYIYYISWLCEDINYFIKNLHFSMYRCFLCSAGYVWMVCFREWSSGLKLASTELIKWQFWSRWILNGGMRWMESYNVTLWSKVTESWSVLSISMRLVWILQDFIYCIINQDTILIRCDRRMTASPVFH